MVFICLFLRYLLLVSSFSFNNQNNRDKKRRRKNSTGGNTTNSNATKAGDLYSRLRDGSFVKYVYSIDITHCYSINSILYIYLILYRLICPACKRSKFINKVGFVNHCRILHRLKFSSFEDASS